MKKLLFTLVVMLTTLSASAMTYNQAREQALFLTDKMAYELDLTEDQYEAAFEVNLDYLMSVNTVDDCFSDYWTRRNLDLSYILYDWQYRTFCGLDYFYRPLYWGDGFWHFRIFAHYPHHDFFYFGRPGFFDTYRGGHAWGMNGGRSWYNGRDFGGNSRFGMRGGYDRGGYRNMNRGWNPNDGGSRGMRQGSAMGQRQNGVGSRSRSSFNGSGMQRGNGSQMQNGSRSSFSGRPSSSVSGRSNGNYSSRQGSNYGGRQSSTRQTAGNSSSRSTGSYSPSRSFSSSHSSGSSSSSRSMSSPSTSRSSSSSYSGGSHSSGFSGGGHSSGSSFGGGHSGGNGGGGHAGGGRR